MSATHFPSRLAPHQWSHALTICTMDQELNQNKRLREMFRLLQRSKKQTEKAQTAWPKKTPPPKQRPPTPSAKPYKKVDSKQGKKSPKKGESSSGGEEDDESSQELSHSERRRREIRKKYGIDKKDEEFFQRADKSDVEEFENVNAALRPAATKMRKAKLKWKYMQTPQSPTEKVEKTEKSEAEKSSGSADRIPSSDGGSAADDSFIDLTEIDEVDSTQSGRDAKPPPSSKSLERLSRMAGTPKEKVEKLMRELHVLYSKVDQLEEALRKTRSFVKKLRMRLASREQTITELNKKIRLMEQETERKSKEEIKREKSEEERPSKAVDSTTKLQPAAEQIALAPEQDAVARRGLDIMKRNQILEGILKPHEARVLAKYFEAEVPKADATVNRLIDKAFNYGIEVLLMRPDLFEDVVDNELRLFLLDSAKAKQVLLNCMLLHAEYVPIAWGGDVIAKRNQERQAKERAAKSVEQQKAEPEKERTSNVPASSSFFDYVFGSLLKETPKQAPPASKTSSTKEEKKQAPSGSGTSLQKGKTIQRKALDSDRETSDREGNRAQKSSYAPPADKWRKKDRR